MRTWRWEKCSNNSKKNNTARSNVSSVRKSTSRSKKSNNNNLTNRSGVVASSRIASSRIAASRASCGISSYRSGNTDAILDRILRLERVLEEESDSLDTELAMVLITGDLVTTGSSYYQWQNQFSPNGLLMRYN